MKKFKNIGILVFISIVGILAFYFVGSGFQKQGNAYISDFWEDYLDYANEQVKRRILRRK